MPPLFQPVKTIQSILEATSVVNGKVYFAQDSERLFFDYDNQRTEVRDIIMLNTEAERADMLAPKNKFYFVLETKILWVYKDGTWYEASSGAGAGGSISIYTHTFSAGTDIASVTLDQAISGESSIISINVDNTVLLRDTYSLSEDGTTINFAEPITAELGIDVVYVFSEDPVSTASAMSMPSSSIVEISEDSVLTANRVYTLALNADINLSLGSWSATSESKIILYLTVPANHALTLPADIKWKNGEAPALEVDGHYILEFRSIDGGNTVYGSIDKYI